MADNVEKLLDYLPFDEIDMLKLSLSYCKSLEWFLSRET